MAETIIKDVKLKIGTEAQFQSKLKDLAVGTLVGTTDSILESDLDTTIVNKLTLASNALPKPTNNSTGSTGQVLRKTSSGSEWSDESSKSIYLHHVRLEGTDIGGNTINVMIDLFSTESATITSVESLQTDLLYLPCSGYIQVGENYCPVVAFYPQDNKLEYIPSDHSTVGEAYILDTVTTINDSFIREL